MYLHAMAFGLFLFSLSVQANETLDNFLNGFQSLQANFTQTLYDEKGEILEVSRGEVYLQRPGRFRWQYQDPYQQLIVANGKHIWIYDQDLEQVTIKDFDVDTQNTPALLLSSERPISDFFTVHDLPNSTNNEQQIKLLPKSQDAQFSTMQLLFDGQSLNRLHVQDKLGQTSVIAFTQQQQNPVLNSDLFEFTPPEGIDLIDGRE